MSSTGELLDGRYRLGPLLGRGGMSDVFRATDQRTGVDVAIKIVRSPDAEYARRSAQEAQALRRFHHPGLVQLLDTGVNGDMAYLVMEFVDGSSLAETLRLTSLSTAQTADIGTSLAGALAYVHAQGVVHRDVKPANILLGSDGRARLTDFGIARLVDTSSLTLTGTMLGTATYMAPEQLEDHAVGPAADVWSLGIVLLECLTGQRVYAGTPSEVIARRLAGPVLLPDGLPVPWKLLLTGMLAHEPENRLSAADVASMLVTPAFSTLWEPPAPLSDLPTSIVGRTVSNAGHDGGTVIRAPNAAPSTRRPTLTNGDRMSRGRIVAIIVSAVVIVGAVTAFALAANNKTPPTTTSTPSTTTTVPPTTTTTLPSVPHALAKIVNDVVAGQSSGLIGPQAGQSISAAAQQAVTDLNSGNAQQAASDLQQAATTIAVGVSMGYIGKANGVLLQSDLSSLATALGLGAAATPTTAPATTTTTTTPAPPFGNGNGNGNGHNG
jgi:serine/threonine protein kinase